jgi:hypothetical protein
MSEEKNVCPPAAPKQDRTTCKDGQAHDFIRQKNYLKDSKQKQLKICSKCGLEEFKSEICKHCRFFVANSILGILPQTGMSDAGYCSKHRTLYSDTQPACVQFTRFIPMWRRLLLHENGNEAELEESEEEKEKWKNKKLKKVKGEEDEGSKDMPTVQHVL